MSSIALRKLSFSGILLAALLLAGCGRIVTDKSIKDSSGQTITDYKEAEISVYFAGDLDVRDTRYKYYLIVSTSNIRVDYLLNGTYDYFASPDDYAVTHNEKVIQEYYQQSTATDSDMQRIYEDYFAGWSDFFVYDYSSRQLLGWTGPFIYGNSINPKPTGWSVTQTGKRLTWKMPLLYADFYVTILTVYDDGSYPKLLRDGLDILGHVVSGGQRQITEHDTVDMHTNIPPALDIDYYTITVTEY